MSTDQFSFAVFTWLNRSRKACRHLQLKRQLKNRTTESYTSDWLSPHLQNWQNYLEPLMGQANIHGLEIGSYEGRSAVWLLEQVLSHPSSSLTCVDPFLVAGSEARFDHNTSVKKQTARLRKHKGFSQHVLPELTPNFFDLIYIDGSHVSGTVLLDAFLSWPLLKSGGILIFDDYLLKRDARMLERPKLAIDLFLKYHDQEYELLHSGDQVIVRKKQRPDFFSIAS